MLDFDSTTGELDGHMRASVNVKFGTSYQQEEITSWAWWDTRPQEQGEYVWGPECFQNKEWTLAMPPVEGAIEGITELLDDGHTIALVSDRAPHMGLWLAEWLRTHRLPIPVHTTNRHDGPTKLDVIRKLGLQLVIEDAPHHAVEMSASGDVAVGVLLLDKPWNRDVFHAKIGRCFGWDHVLDSVSLLQFMWGADLEMVIRN